MQHTKKSIKNLEKNGSQMLIAIRARNGDRFDGAGTDNLTHRNDVQILDSNSSSTGHRDNDTEETRAMGAWAPEIRNTSSIQDEIEDLGD